MTSFFVRKASIFVRRRFSDSISLSCWDCSSATCWSSALQLGLRELLALERGARELLVAGGERLAGLRVELDDRLLELGRLHAEALLRRHDVGDALLDVLQRLELLLVAVVERLAGILRPVEQLRHLRFDDGRHPPGQTGHSASSEDWVARHF